MLSHTDTLCCNSPCQSGDGPCGNGQCAAVGGRRQAFHRARMAVEACVAAGYALAVNSDAPLDCKSPDDAQVRAAVEERDGETRAAVVVRAHCPQGCENTVLVLSRQVHNRRRAEAGVLREQQRCGMATGLLSRQQAAGAALVMIAE